MKLSVAAGGLADAGIDFTADGDTEITGVVLHTDRVGAGSLFCCVKGATVDGHDLAATAVERGASALLVERHLDLDLPQITVASVRHATGPIAARFHGDPSRALEVFGVTGTNGKTTTVAMLRKILEVSGRRVELIGTLAPIGGPPTTPDAPDLQAQLAAWRDAGVDSVVMEVSSHALAMGRVAGTRFAVAGFTMLGHDHLDLHGDIESYFEAKASLFDPSRTHRAVIRVDDPWGERLRARLEGTDVEVRPYALADAVGLETGLGGSTFELRGARVALDLPGDHNVANALCAAGMADWVGVTPTEVAAGLAEVGVVAGRFERIDEGQPFTLAVDYAHTPDALESVLRAARAQAVRGGGRVVVVFGCGGDKDRAKRPEMGRVASTLADLVVVTSDNPRSEDPAAIIAEIVSGIGPGTEMVVIPDRAEAIHHAARAARDHDVVIVAGKGHETTQTVGDTVVDFDDRVVSAAALRELATR